jgi:hypothetical protein
MGGASDHAHTKTGHTVRVLGRSAWAHALQIVPTSTLSWSSSETLSRPKRGCFQFSRGRKTPHRAASATAAAMAAWLKTGRRPRPRAWMTEGEETEERWGKHAWRAGMREQGGAARHLRAEYRKLRAHPILLSIGLTLIRSQSLRLRVTGDMMYSCENEQGCAVPQKSAVYRASDDGVHAL